MKKVIVFIICLTMICGIAMADIPDISSATPEELEELYYTIGAKLWGEKISGEKGAKLLYGTYIIGKDIPAGSYVVEAKDLESSKYMATFIDLYSSDDKDADPLQKETIGYSGKTTVILNCADGNTLTFFTYGKELELRIYTLSAYMNNLE